MRDGIKSIKNFYLRYESRFMLGAFVGGFIIDNLTLTRIDRLFDNAVLFLYIVIIAGMIVFRGLIEGRRIVQPVLVNLSPFATVIMQFAFGGIFSGFVIFYTRSASLAASWPFIAILLVLFFGNEIFKAYYRRLVFQISVFFFVIFSFLIFFIPVLFKTFGALTFLVSGLLSVLLIGILMIVLARIIPDVVDGTKRVLFGSIGTIYIVMHVLYFTNIIPPIPLALKNAGIYHLVERVDAGYAVEFEQPKWYEIFKDSDTVFHYTGVEPVYALSVVFAPTALNTDIFHRWQYFDEEKKEWKTTDVISFPIVGGRGEGYRGYSRKSVVFPGRWRVDVETSRGQLVGRIAFVVVNAEDAPDLVSESI